jgi:hypothetical protein
MKRVVGFRLQFVVVVEGSRLIWLQTGKRQRWRWRMTMMTKYPLFHKTGKNIPGGRVPPNSDIKAENLGTTILFKYWIDGSSTRMWDLKRSFVDMGNIYSLSFAFLKNEAEVPKGTNPESGVQYHIYWISLPQEHVQSVCNI